MPVDFVFADSQTVNGIFEDGKDITFEGVKLRIPSLQHLIALKLHAAKQNQQRELKDIPDIIELMRKYGISSKSPDFQSLCLKYGSEKLYKIIQGYLT